MSEALLKAGILEGVAVVFSLHQGNTWWRRLTHKTLVAGIYAFSLWVVSSSVLNQSLHHQQVIAVTESKIQELTSEISKMESTRDILAKADRLSLARKYDLSLADLRLKLDDARNTQIQLPNAERVSATLWTLIGFRLLVMVSNLFCLQVLSSRLGLKVNSDQS